MIFQDGNSKWLISLDDAKVEGYYAIPVTHFLSFFRLKGRTSIISIENLKSYCGDYLLYSPQEKRYYIKEYHGYLYNEFMDLVYSGVDIFINNLSNYIANGHIWLLYNGDMVKEMKAMLGRVYKTHFTGEGMLSYKLFIQILDLTVKLEEYKDYGRGLTGTKTIQNQLQSQINELWNIAFKN